jgi:hypothetical protein
MVANHELGGDTSGYVSVDLDTHDGEDSSALFTTQTREATDELINALVRARNSAYPDAGSLATFQAACASGAVDIRESPSSVPPAIASFVSDVEAASVGDRWLRAIRRLNADEAPEPAEQPQSEQPRRQAALRRVIDRELDKMDWEGV